MGRTILPGFAAVLVFHQGAARLPHALTAKALVGVFGHPHGSREALRPAAGAVLGVLGRRARGRAALAVAVAPRALRPLHLLSGFVLGVSVATPAGFAAVAHAKGLPHFADGDQRLAWRAGLLNGSRGRGTAPLLRPLRRFG